MFNKFFKISLHINKVMNLVYLNQSHQHIVHNLLQLLMYTIEHFRYKVTK